MHYLGIFIIYTYYWLLIKAYCINFCINCESNQNWIDDESMLFFNFDVLCSFLNNCTLTCIIKPWTSYAEWVYWSVRLISQSVNIANIILNFTIFLSHSNVNSVSLKTTIFFITIFQKDCAIIELQNDLWNWQTFFSENTHFVLRREI